MSLESVIAKKLKERGEAVCMPDLRDYSEDIAETVMETIRDAVPEGGWINPHSGEVAWFEMEPRERRGDVVLAQSYTKHSHPIRRISKEVIADVPLQ